ncbi:hypothetical protein [Streptomyces hilarionis]|uniref:hypothetical protein n=1 Tax=Streptomyces hilarionis TaxID=2839954 RepID=UPI00211A556E|nr:hypothetical protein [Streptomyces hilarionis]
MSASPAVRSLRAGVFAVLCVLLAAGGHALATGAAPSAWVQIVAAVPVFAGACLLGGRERSPVGIGASTLASQGALHVAFHAARPHSATVVHGMRMFPSAAHHLGRHTPASPAVTSHAPAAHALAAHAVTPHATVAHLLAALALTWWLWRGEAALWSLLRWAVALVPGLAAWWRLVRSFRGGGGTPGRVRFPADGARPPRPARLRHAVHRRGPPTGTSYAL